MAHVEAPRLSVVVPTHQRAEEAARAARAWLSQRGAPQLEVVLVDDGSTEATRRHLHAAVPDDPRVRLVLRPHAGRAAARNAGLALVRGATVLFADDDVLPDGADALARWCAHLGPRAPAWVPRMSTTDAVVRTPLQSAWRERLERGGRRPNGAPLGPGGFWFAALLVDRAALHGQRFDEAFVGYGWEDMEFGLRLHRAGTIVRLAADVRVWHEDPVRLPVLLSKYEAMGRASWTFRRLHPGPRVAWWTGTSGVVRAWRRFIALERRGAAAALRLSPWVDAPVLDGVPSTLLRDLHLALEGAYARGVRHAFPDGSS
jgi:glycosyltransferase involved in cell wall biosynthesis